MKSSNHCIQLLQIKNLALIEEATIHFGEGLNIVTGETGSGKSVLLSALRFLTGEKGGAEWIREGAEMAVIEGELALSCSEMLGDIPPPKKGEPLLIRREIHRSGKNRSFVQDHLVSASFLRKLTCSNIEMVDQSSAPALCAREELRKMLDAFADTASDLELLATSYREEMAAKKRLDAACDAEKDKVRNLGQAEISLQTIEEVNWIQGEEERLNEEHSFFSHAQELLEKVGSSAEGLAAASGQIRQLFHLLTAASKFDARLKPFETSVKGAGLELEETERALRSYLEQCDADPLRLANIEQRLKEIEQLKRRFGATWEAVEKEKKELKREIQKFSFLEEEIETLREALQRVEQTNRELSSRISERRKQAAILFSAQVLEELQALNLPYAQFEVSLTTQPLSSHGIDEIRFLFSANPGLSAIPLEICASGGELSRLLLAIKITLSTKKECSCLIFDEIDSNVGGHTAAILGEKLKTLSHNRQVICVTHFVQVAKTAMDHFFVYKEEKSGLAITQIRKLTGPMLEQEYHRMLGLKAF